MALTPFLSIAFWSFLLWKVWKRPHNWGLGVGIFLLLMIAFQCYLWWQSINDPELEHLNFNRSVSRFILLYELPIFIAGVSCIFLRFSAPINSTNSRR